MSTTQPIIAPQLLTTTSTSTKPQTAVIKQYKTLKKSSQQSQPNTFSADQFDISKSISYNWIQREYVDTGLLLNPLTFCHCGSPCSCIVLDYISRDEWFYLHLHIIYYSASYYHFLETCNTLELSLSDLIQLTDRISSTPLINNIYAGSLNNVSKFRPLSKRSLDVELNQLYSSNTYPSNDSENLLGSGNNTDSLLYKTKSPILHPSTHQLPSLQQPQALSTLLPSHQSLATTPTLQGQGGGIHHIQTPSFTTCPSGLNNHLEVIASAVDDDDDDYNAFDSKYDEDENVTRNTDRYYNITNFSQTILPPPHLPLAILSKTTKQLSSSLSASSNTGESNHTIGDLFASTTHGIIPYSIHPQSIGSAIYQYDPSYIRLHQAIQNNTTHLYPGLYPSSSSTTSLSSSQQRSPQQLQYSYTYETTYYTRPTWLTNNNAPIPSTLQTTDFADAISHRHNVNSNNITPLLLAIHLSHFKCLEILIYHGASLNLSISIPIHTINSLHHPRMRLTALDLAVSYLFKPIEQHNDFSMLLHLLLYYQVDVYAWTIDHLGNNIFQRLLLSYNPYYPSISAKYPHLPPKYTSYIHWVFDLVLQLATWFDPYHRNDRNQLLLDVASHQYTQHVESMTTTTPQSSNNSTNSAAHLSIHKTTSNNNSNFSSPVLRQLTPQSSQQPQLRRVQSIMIPENILTDNVTLTRVYNESQIILQQARPLNLAACLSLKAVNKSNTNNVSNVPSSQITTKNIASENATATNEDDNNNTTHQESQFNIFAHYSAAPKVTPSVVPEVITTTPTNSTIILLQPKDGIKQNPLSVPIKRKFIELRHFSDLFLPFPSLQLVQKASPPSSPSPATTSAPQLTDSNIIVCDRSYVSPAKKWLFSTFLGQFDQSQLQPKLSEDQLSPFFKLTSQLHLSPHKLQSDDNNIYISPHTSKTLLMIMIEDDQQDNATFYSIQKEQLMLWERYKYEYTYLFDRVTFNQYTATQQAYLTNTKPILSTAFLLTPLPLSDLTTLPSAMHNPLLASKTKQLLLLSTINLYLIQLRIHKRICFIDLLLSSFRYLANPLPYHLYPLLLSHEDTTTASTPTDPVMAQILNNNINIHVKTDNQQSLFESTAFAFSSLPFFVQLDHTDMIGFTAFDHVSSTLNNKTVFDMLITAFLSYPASAHLPSSSTSSSSFPPTTQKHSLLSRLKGKDYGTDYVLMLLPNKHGEDSLDISIFNQDKVKQQIIATLNIHTSRSLKQQHANNNNNNNNSNNASTNVSRSPPSSPSASKQQFFPNNHVTPQINGKRTDTRYHLDSQGNDVSLPSYRSPRLSIGSMQETANIVVSQRTVKRLSFIQRKYTMLRRAIRGVLRYKLVHSNADSDNGDDDDDVGIKNGSLPYQSTTSYQKLESKPIVSPPPAPSSGGGSRRRSIFSLLSSKTDEIDTQLASHVEYDAKTLYTALLSLPFQFRLQKHQYTLHDLLHGIITAMKLTLSSNTMIQSSKSTSNTSIPDNSSLLYEYKWWKITLPLSRQINPLLYQIPSNTLQSICITNGLNLQQFLHPYLVHNLLVNPTFQSALGEAVQFRNKSPGKMTLPSFFTSNQVKTHSHMTTVNDITLKNAKEQLFDDFSLADSNLNNLLQSLVRTSSLRQTIANDVDINLYYNLHEKRPVEVLPWYFMLAVHRHQYQSMLLRQFQAEQAQEQHLQQQQLQQPQQQSNQQQIQQKQQKQPHGLQTPPPIQVRGAANPSISTMSKISTPSPLSQIDPTQWILPGSKHRTIFQLLLRIYPNNTHLLDSITQPRHSALSLNSPDHGDDDDDDDVVFNPKTGRLGQKDDIHRRYNPKDNLLLTTDEAQRQANRMDYNFTKQLEDEKARIMASQDRTDILLRISLLQRIFTTFCNSPDMQYWEEYTVRCTNRKRDDYYFMPTNQDIYLMRQEEQHQLVQSSSSVSRPQNPHYSPQSSQHLQPQHSPSQLQVQQQQFQQQQPSLPSFHFLPSISSEQSKPSVFFRHYDDLGDSIIDTKSQFIGSRNAARLRSPVAPQSQSHTNPLSSWSSSPIVPSPMDTYSSSTSTISTSTSKLFNYNEFDPLVVLNAFNIAQFHQPTVHLFNNIMNYTPSYQQHQQHRQQQQQQQQQHQQQQHHQQQQQQQQQRAKTIPDLLRLYSHTIKRIQNPTYLNSLGHLDMMKVLFCTHTNTLNLYEVTQHHNTIQSTNPLSLTENHPHTGRINNTDTNSLFTQLNSSMNSILNQQSEGPSPFLNYDNQLVTRFNMYSLYRALLSIFQQDIISFYLVREQYNALLGSATQLLAMQMQTATTFTSTRGLDGDTGNIPAIASHFHVRRGSAMGLQTQPQTQPQPQTHAQTHTQPQTHIQTPLGVVIPDLSTPTALISISSHSASSQSLLALNTNTPSQSLSPSSTADRLQQKAMFMRNIPLLISSINDMLLGYTHALLLLDSNPNTCSYSKFKSHVSNSTLYVQLSAVQNAARNFCPISSTLTTSTSVDANITTQTTFVFYAISLLKLLMRFNAFPYPQAPSLPLPMDTNNSTIITTPQSYITLYHLVLTRHRVPPLAMLQFIDAIDYMHINTSTTGFSSIPNPSSSLLLQPYVLPSNTDAFLQQHDQEDISQKQRIQFAHSIITRGYSPLFLSFRHHNAYQNIQSLQFMFQNRAHVLTFDEDHGFCPLMALVQFPHNTTLIQYLLHIYGVQLIFSRSLITISSPSATSSPPSLPIKVNVTDPTRFGVKSPHASSLPSNSSLKSITQPVLPTEHNAGAYFGTTGAALRTAILEKHRLPSVFDPWFTDGLFYYSPLLSQQSRCIFEYAREEYIPILLTASLQWKNDAMRDALTLTDQPPHQLIYDNNVNNLMVINQ